MGHLPNSPGLGRDASLLRDPALLPALAAVWISLGVFVLYPLFRLLAQVFWSDGALSFASLSAAVRDGYDRQAFANSLWLAGAVAAAETFLGYLFAFAVTRTRLPLWAKGLIGAVTTLPFISPPFTH